MKAAPAPHHPILLVSFDDAYAAQLIPALEDLAPVMHVSPLMRTLRASLESLQPAIAIFDLQTIKTEERSIFDIMDLMGRDFPDIRKIALGYQSVSAQVISAMKAGACDFLDRDAPGGEIRAHLAQHLRQGRMTRKSQGARTIALVSARDNEGQSDLAANLAAYVARAQHDDGVLLLDLNLQTSRLEIDFDVEVTYSVRDALNELLRLDKATFKNVVVKHKSGLHLLPLAPANGQEESVSPQELATLLGTIKSFFSIIIINAGCLRERACHPYLLPLCDEVLVVCPQLIGSVRDARNIFSANEIKALPATKFALVVSRHHAEIDLPAEQIAARTGLTLAGVVPQDWVLLANSHNLGAPVVCHAPRSKYAKAVRALAHRLFPETALGDSEAADTGGLLHFAHKMMRIAG